MVELFEQVDVDNAISEIHNQEIGLQRLTAYSLNQKVCAKCQNEAIC